MTAPVPGSNPGAHGAALREGRRDPALILLGALAAAPLVPTPWSVAVLAVAAALLLWRRPPLREALAIAIGAAIAFVLLAAAFLLERRPTLPQPAAQRLAVERYTEVWRELQEAVESAVAAATSIGVPPRDDSARLQMFHALGELSESRRHAGLTFLLFDPDGSVSAWAGEGLLHEPAPESLLTAGAQYIEGFGSATLLAVRPVPSASGAASAPPVASGEGLRPWRLVAGRSVPTDALPFEPPGEIAHASYRWWFLPAGAPLAAGAVRIAAPGAPAIGVSLASPAAAAPLRAGNSERLRRAAGFAVGLILLALGTMRAVGTAVLSRTVVRAAPRAGAVSALVAGGAMAWAWAGGAPPAALVALAAAALLAALLAQVPRGAAIPATAPDSASTAAAFALGVLAVAVLAGLVHTLLSTQGLYDLGSALAGGAQAIVLRLACATAAFGLFYGASRLTSRLRERESWAWASAGLLLLAAAFHDSTWIAFLAAAAGGGALVVWLAGARPLRRPLTAATALILSALAAALTWETVYRRDLRAELAVTASRLGPPDASETAALSAEMEDFVTGLDLAALVPRDPRALDRQDLAYRLWRHSPVARRNALSALVVVGADGGRSAFSFGLPISSDGEPLAEAGAREALVPAGWEAAAVDGEGTLDVAGEAFGVVRYWLLPLPGFRLGGRETEDVRLALLRGGPARLGIEGLPAPAVLALYGADGRIRPSGLGSPWPERPPLDPVLAATGAARVDTPDGPAWGWTAPADAAGDRASAGSRLALYLPAPSPRAALDRVGTHALGVVLLLFAGALLALLLGLPRAAFRDALRRALRSYSQRLILVYSLLLLLPLLIASALLVRRFEARSAAEQRAQGDQALLAAGRVLGQYLGTLTPGFGLGTAIDDPLLAWLAGVVRHDVSLYWGSGVYASSRRELFTAGLLPKRIPGEVSARLRLLGYGLAGRTRQVGDTAYLEVYSHLEVPGGGAAGSSLAEDLALSVPLLAQQEDAAAELDSLRRQAVLVTAALFLLLVALGTRLARGFTQPLQELVHGTQRIAAGAAELGLRPAELELAALAEAIDRMANKIAEGRERLVREKQVVERVVENITAGVVSLDAHGRVLMANRVAVELMAPVVGEPLAAVLRRRPQLAPLAAFLETWSAETRQTTVRIAAASGDEGGEREWTAIWAPVPGAGEPAALLVVEDSTEVLRGQRLLAWAEMARIIAHEIKNPLTPIRLSAEHMREVYGRDPERFAPVFERCTTNILKQVEELRAIASEFSIYSHIPALQAQPGNLLETVRAVVEAYAAAPPPGVVVRSTFADGELAARFDPRLLGRALRNVLENAVRASAGGGEVVVAVEAAADTVVIAVSDQGPGVPEADLARIFDPYFSTHAGGTGLGLPITRRIVDEHGGKVAARNRPGGGFEVTITIPR